MNQKNTYFLVIILLGIIMGIICGFANFPISLMILGFIIIVGIVSLIFVIIGIFNSNKLTKYGIVNLFSILLFFICSQFTAKKIDDFRVNKVEKIIARIEQFQSENGKKVRTQVDLLIYR